MVRILSVNVRNVKALDMRSFWWLRRRRFVRTVRRIDADIVCVQEAYPSQIRYIERHAFRDGWTRVSQGRNEDGGGEACAVWVRDAKGAVVDSWTRWYGASPDRPGTMIPGAGHPRIATVLEVGLHDGAGTVVLANTHLDERSTDRRRQSLEQLAGWLGLTGPVDASAGEPRHVVVAGDLNCRAAAPELAPLLDGGLRDLLAADDGATSGAFGGTSAQIDHVLVSADLTGTAWVDREGGAVSDHWPVVAEIEPRSEP